jgi:TRAP-type C4-dicarboxylate transport system permease small subunit
VERVFRVIDRAFEIAIIAVFIMMVVVGGMQVFNRFVLNRSLSWSSELQRYAHIWLVYIAIPVAYRRGRHIGMDVVKQRMSATAQRALAFFNHTLWILLSASIIIFTRRIMQVAVRQKSPGMGLRMDFVYLGLVVGSGYLLFVALRKLVAEIKSVVQSRASGGDPVGGGGPS